MDNLILDVKTKSMAQTKEEFDQLGNAISNAANDYNALKKAQDIVGQSTDGLNKKQLDLRDKINSIGGILQKMQGTTRETTNLYKEMERQLVRNIAEYERETAAIKKATPAQQSLTKEVRQTTQELARMMVQGDLSVAQIYEMAKGAGETKDAIGDAKNAITVLGSDTFHLDATAQGLQGIAAGYQVAQGAMALFGIEDEDTQKGLLKLNGIMAITQGAQTIFNILQKESAFMLGLNVVQQRAATVAQRIYAVAVGQSTGAMFAFRFALLGLGIGAVIALVYLAVKAWSDWRKEVDGGAKALESAKKAGSDYYATEKTNLETLVRIAKDRNLSDETRNKALKKINEQYPEYLNNLSLENINTAEGNKLINKQVELISKLSILKGSTKVIEDLGKELAELQSATGDAGFLDRFGASISSGKWFSNAEEATKIFRDKQQADAKEQIKNLIKLQKQMVEELDKQGFGTQALDALGFGEKDAKKVKEKLKKELELLEIPMPKIKFTQIDEKVRDAFKELQAKIDFAQQELITEFSIDPNSESLEPLSARLRDLIRQSEILKAQFDIIKNPPKKYGTNKDILGDVIPELPDGPAESEPPAPKITLFERIFGTAKQNEERQEMLLRYAQGALKIVDEINQIGSQIGDIATQAIKIRSDNELAALDEKRKKGLISEKKYEEESAKIKNEAAAKQRKVEIAMAAAKIPQAVLSAYIAGLEIGGPAAPIIAGVMAGLAGAFGLAQVALIAAAPLPKFFKGILRIPRGNNPKGQDTIPAMLNEGESVMTTAETDKHFDVLKAIRENKFDRLYIKTNELFKRRDLFGPAGLVKNIAYPVRVGDISSEKEQRQQDIYDSLDKKFGELKKETSKMREELWYVGAYIKQGNTERSRGTSKMIDAIEKNKDGKYS